MRSMIFAIVILGSANAFGTDKNTGCTMCDFPLPAEAVLPSNGDVCDDLGYSVCTSQEGGARYTKLIQQLGAEMQTTLSSALDRAAAVFGAQDSASLIVKEVSKSMRLRSDLSATDLSMIANGSASVDVAAAYSECAARMSEVNQYNYYSDQDPESLRAHISKLETLIRLNREGAIELYSYDASGFLRELSNKCQELGTAQAQAGFKLPIDTNVAAQTLARACSDTNSIRQAVLKVYRHQRSLDSSDEMRALIAGLIDALTFDIRAFAAGPETRVSGQSALEKLRNRYTRLRVAPLASCPYVSISGAIRSARDNAMDKLTRSRVFVEAMIESVYTPERRAKLERLFGEVKNEVKKVAARVVSDPLKLAEINARYDQLKLMWVNKPAERFYEKDPATGVELLSKEIELSDFAVKTAFGQDAVAFFTNLNAFYMPQVKQGAMEIPTSVTLMPMFFLFGERNPFTLIGVLAHEVGHQIGPMLSAVNGFDLRPNYRPLLQCLARPDAIGMQDHQSDESIADFVSAEVVATMLNQLPERKRRRAGLAAIGDYCYFNAMSFGSIAIRTDGVHPESMLRISGIYGGNSGFRKAIGCSAASPTYRTCDLEHAD